MEACTPSDRLWTWSPGPRGWGGGAGCHKSHGLQSKSCIEEGTGVGDVVRKGLGMGEEWLLTRPPMAV